MRRTLLALGAALLAGCAGKPTAVTVHPVSGRVMVDDKPAAGVRVYLMPTSAPSPPEVPTNPNGVTDADGRFALSTFGDKDGAAEGGYQVVFFWPPEKAEREEHDEDRLLGWYDARHSRLTARVNAGDNELPTFELKRHAGPPPVSEGVPGRN